MDKKNVISVKNLNKVYSKKSGKPIHAINNLNLDVQESEIFGLLGPNGAGKTTFINILAGIVVKTSGKVNVWGFDLDKNPRQVRASIGIVPQEINLDPFFTPKKQLDVSRLKNLGWQSRINLDQGIRDTLTSFIRSYEKKDIRL